MMVHYRKFMKGHSFGCDFSVVILYKFGRSIFVSDIFSENIGKSKVFRICAIS